MRIGRRILIAAVAALGLALAGCAMSQAYETMLNGWLGKPADALVRAWGPPQSSYTYGDGRKTLQYSEKETRYYPPMTTYDALTGHDVVVFDGYSRNLTCVTTFEVDAGGIIRSWKWHGNDCSAEPRHDFTGASKSK